MKKIIIFALWISLLPVFLFASDPWEKEGNYSFLTKNSRDYFSAEAPGSNSFASKFLTYDGIKFLVKGPDSWKDYGRLDLTFDNMFSLPVKEDTWVKEVHLLAGGSYSNSYKDDPLLKLFGDNYYYSVLNLIFVYTDGSYKSLSAPMFWDWFHLGRREWSRGGVKVKSLGDNPVRKNCNFYHLSFNNPAPEKALRNILVSDSWLEGIPFSDVFALTIKQ